MNSRIKLIRTSNDLTQQEFADRLGTPRSNIAGYERGARNPSDGAISAMCKEFDINEDWLRHGKGPMRKPVNRDQEIESFMNSILHMESENFRRRLISALTRLNEDEWGLLESMALKLAEETEKGQKSFWPIDATQTESQPGHKIIKIAGRDGSLEEQTLTDEDANEYLNRIDQLPDAGDNL